ncbi:hypothetical protein OEZ85_001740 [Tetradesmus obliquus]|uniref:Bulb-type lectin domain-containing protein n=1 Tax=Tetradesmus obliquus TaxID=3088 RepID=A0ABY8U0R5_TETOB|nr:hypothetical protein OEZ85_001740 [Tetradesmus obliquus]
MFGFAVSSSLDGSTVAVGAPLNTANVKSPGAAFALISRSSLTCEYLQNPIVQPAGSFRYFGAQLALSDDASTLVVLDGVEGVNTANSQGNRPVVHVYRRLNNGTYRYFQKLSGTLRRAMAVTMAVSTTANGNLILVSFSVAEGYTDKRGSAQLFALNGTGTATRYTYLQDLALLNMPAGVSVQYGAASAMSSNGMTIAVSTAASTDSYFKLTYMYRRDTYTGQFRIVSAVSHGAFYGDNWSAGRGVGLTDDNALAITQSGRFMLRVENAMLVVYEWSGSGMSMTWQRRCQLAAPEGYTFRTTGGALSIVEASTTRVKFAAGAYTGALDSSPSSMAVFLYYLNLGVSGSCPYRHAEKHEHNDPYSNYGAAVTITANGNLLLIGAPSAWDNNMQKQYGALYTLDISTVVDDGTVPMTVTAAANTYAGCIAGKDANGNACVTKQAGTVLCKTVTKSDGTVVQYGAAGCTPTPAPPSFWTSSAPGAYTTSTLSAYTNVASSTKGGVGVPTASTNWLANTVQAAAQNAYYGYPVTSTAAGAKTSITPASGWGTSTAAALGGTAPAAVSTTSMAGIGTPSTFSILSTMFSGLAGMLRNALSGSGVASAAAGGTTSLGLPAGAVITNLGVLNGGANTG